MAFRGTESPMDFEWQGYGPADVNSPFHKIAMENQRKRNHKVFESPVKTTMPTLREPNSQPWFFSDAPTAPATPSQFRTSSFTTPRKPVDFDFSSGPESSPAGQADDEDTPNGKPTTMEFTGVKPSTKRNSLFSIYGRFAPSSGRGEIKKPTTDAMVKRIHKRRRKAQNFEKQLAVQRRPSDDTSDDDDARPSSSDSKSDSKSRRNKESKVQEVGWMTGLFTFIHAYPDAPSIIAKYLQVFFNAAILAGCLYMIWSFYATIQADVDRAGEEAKAEILAEMAVCTNNYIANNCGAHTRLPALETICNNWAACMNRDAESVKRARLSAHTFAEIFNSFVEPISLKTMIFTVTFVFLGLFVNNATFTLYRRSQEAHHNMNDNYRQPSGSHMYHANGGNINQFPTMSGQAYDQHHNLSWQNSQNIDGSHQLYRQYQQQLEYQRSPGKDYVRSRSRSPEKKKMLT